MDSWIEDHIEAGRFVEVINTSDDGINLYSKPGSVFFDSSICKDICTWKEEACSADVKGRIETVKFPNGYTPTLTILHTEYKYHHPANHSAPRLMLVIADSKELYKSWCWYHQHKNDTLPGDRNNHVYKWDRHYQNWDNNGTYRDTSIDTIVGMEDVYNSILADVQMMSDKKDIIQSLGLVNSVNYLLVSNPGMGKTSLIRAICTKLNLNIHVIDSEAMSSNDKEDIFHSNANNSNELSVYIFEDFDRYLGTSGERDMASILNGLDGVMDGPMSIRFFTANSDIGGKSIEAFLSRMRRKIHIDNHPHAAYRRSIDIVFPEMPEEDKKKVEDTFASNKITMRQVNNILCAAVIYDDPVTYIMGTFE